MNVTLTQDFGMYPKDTTVDLPFQVAETMIRAGVAVDGDAKPEPVSTTKAYKPKAKSISKAI